MCGQNACVCPAVPDGNGPDSFACSASLGAGTDDGYDPHPDRGIVGNGTYTTAQGEKRQMYLCNVCEKPFSETVGTRFFGLKTPMRTVCIALNELAEGLGVRAVARIHHVEPDTVLEWLRNAGQHCEAVSAYMMQELELGQVQLDELWTFVCKRRKC